MPESIINSVQYWIGRKQAAILPAGTLRARFVLGTFWALAGTLISQGLMVAASILVARWLGRAKYGEIGVVRSTVGVFGLFVGLGLGLTATKYIAELKSQDPARAGRIAALTLSVATISGLIVTAVLVLLSPWLAAHTLASPAVAVPLQLGAGLLFFGELSGVQVCILSGLEAFGALAWIGLWAGLLSFPIILTLTRLGGVNGAVLGLVASPVANCLLNGIALRREMAKAGITISYSGFWGERSVLWRFSLPAFLAAAVVTPVSWVCNAMLVNNRNGYAQMGLFSAADQWRLLVLFLPGIITRVVLPILSSYSSEPLDRTSRFSSTLEAGFAVGILVAFPLITALSFGSSLVVRTYGADFAGMRYALSGLLYAGGLLAIGTPIGPAVQAKGGMWSAFINNFGWALLLLGFFHFLRDRGAWGLSLAYAASYFFLTIAFVWYWCKAGYFPRRLGARTYLATLSLLPFAFVPLYLQPSTTLRVSPFALALSLVAVWLLMPASITGRFRRKPVRVR
jgi:O-antigen/teichoic acid export membrane protein